MIRSFGLMNFERICLYVLAREDVIQSGIDGLRITYRAPFRVDAPRRCQRRVGVYENSEHFSYDGAIWLRIEISHHNSTGMRQNLEEVLGLQGLCFGWLLMGVQEMGAEHMQRRISNLITPPTAFRLSVF